MSRARLDEPVALLDVNVLVALFDPDHVHHELAHDWFADHRSAGWATCPLTENGFLRVLSNPSYGRDALRPDLLVARLRTFRASGNHVFWTDSVSLSDGRLFNLAMAPGARQVTDVYLLGLARRMRGCGRASVQPAKADRSSRFGRRAHLRHSGGPRESDP